MKEIMTTGIFNIAAIYFEKYSKTINYDPTFTTLIYIAKRATNFLFLPTIRSKVGISFEQRDQDAKKKKLIISNSNLNII
jgi:hypothetical protein